MRFLRMMMTTIGAVRDVAIISDDVR